MVTSDVKRTMTKGQRMVRCQRPNSSIGPPIEEYVLRQSYTKVRPDQAAAYKGAHACRLACQLDASQSFEAL